MSDTVSVTVIIAVTILLALFIFRNRLTRFFFRIKELQAQLEADLPTTTTSSSYKRVVVSGNRQTGVDNMIAITDVEGEVTANRQTGSANTMRVDSESQ